MNISKKVISIAAVIAIIVISTWVVRHAVLKISVKKPVMAVKAKDARAKAPAKKTLAKGMGGLTVKAVNSKNKDVALRVRAFRSSEDRSSSYIASFMSGKTQELVPGRYDIQIDTIPQKIYKDIDISKGNETLKDIGASGAILINALNSKKKNAYLPVKITYAKTGIAVATATTNKEIEIQPGVYDLEIGTLPRQVKGDLKVEALKASTVEMGCVAGALIAKATDENKKELRYNVRIKDKDDKDLIVSGVTNKIVDISPGVYTIEVLSSPAQKKKDLQINAGEETVAEFIIKAPAPAAPGAKK